MLSYHVLILFPSLSPFFIFSHLFALISLYYSFILLFFSFPFLPPSPSPLASFWCLITAQWTFSANCRCVYKGFLAPSKCRLHSSVITQCQVAAVTGEGLLKLRSHFCHAALRQTFFFFLPNVVYLKRCVAVSCRLIKWSMFHATYGWFAHGMRLL